jgi:hypothetical protein
LPPAQKINRSGHVYSIPSRIAQYMKTCKLLIGGAATGVAAVHA